MPVDARRVLKSDVEVSPQEHTVRRRLLLMKGRLTSGAAIVRVDPEERQFHVHTELICSQSPFFQAALSSDWKESSERLVTLPEDDAGAFDLYLTWLYTHKIASKPQPGDDRNRTKEFGLLARSIVLGEKLQDVRFKNALIDTLLAVTEDIDEEGAVWYPDLDIVNCIYEGTSHNAPVRRLLIDLWFWHGGQGWFTPDIKEEEYNKTFLIDLVRKLLVERAIPSEGSPCNYINRAYYHEREVAECPRINAAEMKRKAETEDESGDEKQVKRLSVGL